MDASAYFIGFLLLLAGILPTAGYGVVSVTPADFRTAKTCFFLAGLSAFAASVVWAIASEQPTSSKIIVISVVLLCCTIGVVEGLRWLSLREQPVTARAISKQPTSLRLRLLGGPVSPVEMRKENIYQWYAIWSNEVRLNFLNDHPNIIFPPSLSLPNVWVFVILFDVPINISQFVVEPANPKEFPHHEVKTVTNRHAIFITQGADPPEGILDLYAVF